MQVNQCNSTINIAVLESVFVKNAPIVLLIFQLHLLRAFWGQNAERRFCLMWWLLRRLSPSFDVHHKVSGSFILRTVWPRITKFYVDIHSDSFYSHNGYNIISYFPSKVIKKKLFKMSPLMACHPISLERFKQGSPNLYWNTLIRDNQPYKSAGYDVTCYFRSTFIEFRESAR